MDHGMQGQDAAVGQGEDGLVMAFTLVAFALVLGLADGIGWRETKADRNMACLSLLLPPWEMCSPLGRPAGCRCLEFLAQGLARKAAAGTLIPSMEVSTR